MKKTTHTQFINIDNISLDYMKNSLSSYLVDGEHISNTITFRSEDIFKYVKDLANVANEFAEFKVRPNCIVLSSVLHELFPNGVIMKGYGNNDIRDFMNTLYCLLAPGGRIIIRDGCFGSKEDKHKIIRVKVPNNQFITPEDFMNYAIKFYEFNSDFNKYEKLSSYIVIEPTGRFIIRKDFCKAFMNCLTWAIIEDSEYECGYTIDGGTFRREASQNHMIFSIEDWEDMIPYYSCAIKEDTIQYYKDDYVPYLKRFVEWDENLEELWKINTAIAVINKKEN